MILIEIILSIHLNRVNLGLFIFMKSALLFQFMFCFLMQMV